MLISVRRKDWEKQRRQPRIVAIGYQRFSILLVDWSGCICYRSPRDPQRYWRFACVKNLWEEEFSQTRGSKLSAQRNQHSIRFETPKHNAFIRSHWPTEASTPGHGTMPGDASLAPCKETTWATTARGHGQGYFQVADVGCRLHALERQSSQGHQARQHTVLQWHKEDQDHRLWIFTGHLWTTTTWVLLWNTTLYVSWYRAEEALQCIG